MKTAKVVPVYKSGDRLDSSNYRPISLLPAISKLLEKTINKRIVDFFEDNKLFYEHQYGFRKHISTSNAIFNLTNNIKHNMDNSMLTGGVFLDLSKAFDMIPHSILMKKLYNYAIRGKAYDILESYLTNRSQSVYLSGTKSSKQNISCGVPQGSVLGPTLFLIYINDVFNSNKLLVNPTKSSFIIFVPGN